MGSVLPEQCSGGAARRLSVRRTVLVVMMVVWLTVTAGQEFAHNEHSHLDSLPAIANTSKDLSSPRQSYEAEYYKCRCDGVQAWNGSQCIYIQMNVSEMVPSVKSVVVSLMNDSAGVTVREVQCPKNNALVLLDLHNPSHQLTLLPNGALSWQQREYADYCLDHTVDFKDEQTWEARVCLPPPLVPRCCLGRMEANADGLSCSDDLAIPFSPSIAAGDEFVEWPNSVKHTEMKCNKFEKSVNVSLNTGQAHLFYESGEVSIEWKTAHHIKERQKDGFCVMPQEGGGYMAFVCYEDQEAFHLNYCNNVTCVRKCCPEGEIHGMPNCVPANESQLWQPSFTDSESLTAVPPPKDLNVMYGRPQCAMFLADPANEADKFYLLANGFLFTPGLHEMDPPTHYCVDNFQNNDLSVSTKALICFAETKPEPVCTMAKKTLYPALLLISTGFLGLTLVIYLSMQDLRKKLHGRCIISLASAFFVAYLLMAVSYLTDGLPDSYCIVLAFFKHLSLLAAFFWLNVMCFDIWRTLRKTRVMVDGRWGVRRFLKYCLYAWGCPLTIALAAVAMELLPLSYKVIRPNFKNDFCWFSDKKSMWVYFYLWVSLLVVANIVFFGMVIVILVKGQNNSLLRRSREMNRERMWLYGKLFLVMGVTWLAEMVSYQGGRCVGWIFTDAINALQGLTLFLVFILSRNAIKKIRERWCCGGPHSAVSPSNTGTTSGSLSSSSLFKRPGNFNKSSISSRFSNTSVSIKDGNAESALPLNTLSEAPEDSSNSQKGNAVSNGRDDLNLSADPERRAMMPKGEAALEDIN